MVKLSSLGHPGRGGARRAIGLSKPKHKTYLNELDICSVSFLNTAKLVLFIDVQKFSLVRCKVLKT